MSELVKFPTRPRVLGRLGIAGSSRLTALDAEIRRIDHAVATLRKARTALLVEYRKELRREVGLAG
jgi:hypothetical protein